MFHLISFFLLPSACLVDSRLAWSVHLSETWLGNNVVWFVHLWKTWLGNNLCFLVCPLKLANMARKQCSLVAHIHKAMASCIHRKILNFFLHWDTSDFLTILIIRANVLTQNFNYLQGEVLDVNSTAVVKYAKMVPMETYSTLELVSSLYKLV